MRVPPVPKTFALDMIEFAMAHHSTVFLEVPAFQRALGTAKQMSPATSLKRILNSRSCL
jgi:hypothetical protein